MSYLGNAPARSFISFERQVFTIVNSQTAYALSHSVTNENDIRLVVNNVVQEPGSGKAYTATGTALTLSAALTNGTDEMYCVFLGRATATSAPGAGSIGTAQLAADSVTSAKIVDGAITSAKLASGVGGVAGITSSADATAMTITSAEKIGIGETSPLGLVHIKTADSGASASADGDELVIENGTSSGTAGMTFLSATNGYGSINFGDSDDNNIGIIDYEHSSNTMRISTNAAERMRINSEGNTLINETTAHGVNTGRLQVTGRASSNIARFRAGSNGEQISFHNSSNSQVGTITVNASSTAYNTSSDYRLKENVDYTFDATTKLKQLKPARFNWIADDTNTLIDGFIAHEVQSVVPEAISGTHNEVEVWRDGEELPDGVSIGDNKLDDDGNTIPKYQGIDQSKIVPLLVKTIQELEARITTLENA